MSFFNKLFRQDNKQPQASKATSQLTQLPCTSEQELIERFGGSALEKQACLSEVIGGHNWNVDMTEATIRFGDQLVFPIQVLGTFSHSSGTWLWSWANTRSGLSDSITRQALQLKEYGETNSIDMLRNSEFDAAPDDLHRIGLIASGMFGASGYYIADYGQGAMVVTIQSEQADRLRKNDRHRILTVFPQLISLFEMNHRAALIHYLSDKGYTIADNGTALTATGNGNTLTATFDAQSRLTRLNG